MKLFLLTFLFISSFSLYAQQKYIISGYVKDAATQEDLIGASVWESKTKIGTVTNSYGYFAIEIPITTDTLILRASYSGFLDYSKKIILDKNLQINIMMSTDKEQEQI